MYPRLSLILGATVTLTLLSACGTVDKLSKVGQAPEMTAIENPQLQQGYRPVSLPMPKPEPVVHASNSLWPSNRQTFFKDQRAGNIGDILTVLIDIEDEAELSNQTDRSRTNDTSSSLGSLLGLEASLNKVLPEAVVNTNLADIDSASNFNGSGTTEREEDVELKLAALVTQILPNGNLVIQGRQEVRVNY